MKEVATFQDEIVDKAIGFAQDVVKEVVKRFPRPPGQVKLAQREQLQRYLQMTPQEMNELIRRHGEPAVNHYIYSMEKLRERYSGEQ